MSPEDVEVIVLSQKKPGQPQKQELEAVGSRIPFLNDPCKQILSIHLVVFM